jgi:hypothetical protein
MHAGSGIIAIEYAKIFNYLETKVTLVIRGKSFEAALERIGVDAEVAATLQVVFVPGACRPPRGPRPLAPLADSRALLAT